MCLPCTSKTYTVNRVNVTDVLWRYSFWVNTSGRFRGFTQSLHANARIIPRNRVLLEKFRHTQLVKKFLSFYGIQRVTPEDGGSTFIRSVGIQPPHNMAQQPRKPLTLYFPAMKTKNPQITYVADAVKPTKHQSVRITGNKSFWNSCRENGSRVTSLNQDKTRSIRHCCCSKAKTKHDQYAIVAAVKPLWLRLQQA